MNYEETLEYIHSVSWKGSVPGLERISELLELIGHPERECKFIHVAGTNGKGSTCAMLSSVLRKAGFRTGLYTSPYLIHFNERIDVDGKMIENQELCDVTEYVKKYADSMTDKPTEFELITAVGFEYFKRKKCDIVVCEVGMGGEFDATNVIPTPELAVICNIGLDHTAVLGDTLEKIAATKSGIIKEGCDVVLYRSTESVEAVVEKRCENVCAKLNKADFDSVILKSSNLYGQVFDFKEYKNIELPLLGEHQLKNAAVVLTAIDVLREKGWNISENNIRDGLRDVVWHGRFEILKKDPLFIADGGHNPQCIDALVKSVEKYLSGKKLTVLTGVLGDKDYHCMYKDISKYAKEFITVTPNNPRALSSNELANYLSTFQKPVTACDSIEEGVNTAFEHTDDDGVILCYGSLYMLGDVYAEVDKYIR